MAARKKLTHLTKTGDAHMVDVGAKNVTAREAVAEGLLVMKTGTRALLFSGAGKKGDALAAARIAGIMAAKRTAELIPLCHPIATTFVQIDIEQSKKPCGALVRATVRVSEKTGAEMEALTAASVALLTLYDMLKSAQKDMRIEALRLRKKSGGKSGNLEFP
ncbi:cyclic pyranopterin monophosphate synthase MoaC [soil metagenome]